MGRAGPSGQEVPPHRSNRAGGVSGLRVALRLERLRAPAAEGSWQMLLQSLNRERGQERGRGSERARGRREGGVSGEGGAKGEGEGAGEGREGDEGEAPWAPVEALLAY